MKRLTTRSTHWLTGLVIGIMTLTAPYVLAVGVTSPLSTVCPRQPITVEAEACIGQRLTVDLTAPRSPTAVVPQSDTLQAISQSQANIVFIPEGFSPNDDGINDRFVIRGVDTGLTIQLEVFNRWGHRVYINTDYKNDWEGTANQGIQANDNHASLPDGTYFYVVKLNDNRQFVRFMTIAR